MKIFAKQYCENGRRHILFFGKKIISYGKRKKTKVVLINYTDSKKYGKIYCPIYNPVSAIKGDIPDIYNKDGRKMDMFFLRDGCSAHIPYVYQSQYFLWDRFNIALPVHFYTHGAMLETMGNPKKRFGWLLESSGIVPETYKIFDLHPGLEKDFDAILTYDDRLLDKLNNAVFMPGCAQLWYGVFPRDLGGGGTLDEQGYRHKTKNISIVSSDKRMCALHNFRIALAKKCKEENLADTFGTFDGGSMIPIADSLANYRYSIAIENEVTDLFFTEKIVNCFASMTVPIYLGARKIDKFFNPDGIITISENDFDNLPKILQQCTPNDYIQRLPAIKENFFRSLEYANMDDYLYKKLFLK